MKRQVALEGDRKWYSDHMVELQSEALTAIDKMAAYYGPCALSGGEVYEVDSAGNRNKFKSGLVVLWVAERSQWMVMPLNDNGYVPGYNSTRYLTPSKINVLGEYRMGQDVIAEQYEAVVVSSRPTGSSLGYITIPSRAERITDVLNRLVQKNNTRGLLASVDHSHTGLKISNDGNNNLGTFYYYYDNGLIINLGKLSEAGHFSQGDNIQVRFTISGIQFRFLEMTVEGARWSSWEDLATTKSAASVIPSIHIGTSNYNARALRHDGFTTLNIRATIIRESRISESLLTVTGCAPSEVIILHQPLINSSNYGQVVYRDLRISASGQDAVISIDTNSLQGYAFSLNLTYEHV